MERQTTTNRIVKQTTTNRIGNTPKQKNKVGRLTLNDFMIYKTGQCGIGKTKQNKTDQ